MSSKRADIWYYGTIADKEYNSGQKNFLLEPTNNSSSEKIVIMGYQIGTGTAIRMGEKPNEYIEDLGELQIIYRYLNDGNDLEIDWKWKKVEVKVSGGEPGVPKPLEPTPNGGNSGELVTLEELKRFGWVTANEEFANKLNAALKRYSISNKGSIALFMATMAEESGWGKFSLENRTNFSGMSYGPNTMGAGYIQITHKEMHQLFLKTMGDNFSGENTASYIAKNYPLESAVWFWSSNKAKGTGKGNKWSLNEYVENNGFSKGVFLVTQYYVNGWIRGSKGSDSLGLIKSGAPYDDTSTKGKLKINGYTYDLPVNWDKRSENYDKAIKIWR